MNVNVVNVNVGKTSRALLVSVPWIRPRAKRLMGKSATAEGPVSVGSATALIPNSRGLRVSCVRPALESVLSTSKAFQRASSLLLFLLHRNEPGGKNPKQRTQNKETEMGGGIK